MKKKRRSWMKGIKLACLYSWGCNKIREIGGINELIYSFIIDSRPEKEKIERVLLALKRLEPYRFYQRLADYEGTFCYDERVIRRYWLGLGCFEEGKKELIEMSHNFWVLSKIRALAKILDKERVAKMMDCQVLAGRVVWVKKRKAIILIEEKGEAKANAGFVSALKPEDWVSVHLGTIREKISLVEAANLGNLNLSLRDRFPDLF